LLAQEFRVTGVNRDAAGRISVQFPSDPGASFTLYRGATVTSITNPVATVAGVQGQGVLVDGSPPGASAFYRLLKVLNGPVTTFSSSPAEGEQGVSVNREVVLTFSEPLVGDASITLDQIHADFGGRR